MVLFGLVTFALAYGSGVARAWRRSGIGRGIHYRQIACFTGGWLILVAALASPLDEWSDALFAAHMFQHELLMVAAAPLVAFSRPLIAFAWLLWRTPHGSSLIGRISGASGALSAGVAFGLHAVALWAWHLPPLYEAALGHEWIHAFQHLSFFGTGVLFWWVLAHGEHGRAGYGAAVLYVFATALHSGFLGALITLSPRVWYVPYTSPQSIWQLSPLEDQQVAGLLMWIPASVIFAGAGLAFLLAWLRESARRVEHGRPTRWSVG
jgi:cytochrome c oxidase assembly factor CtaG